MGIKRAAPSGALRISRRGDHYGGYCRAMSRVGGVSPVMAGSRGRDLEREAKGAERWFACSPPGNLVGKEEERGAVPASTCMSW